jgi:hypothetical protein
MDDIDIRREWMLRADFVKKIGLFNGTLAYIIVFYEYSRNSGNRMFAGYADELMGKVYKSFHREMPMGLNGGISGIAWGITYLYVRGFLDGDLNEILKDFDEKVVKFMKAEGHTVAAGKIFGHILYYVLYRIHIDKVYKIDSPFTKEMLYNSVFNNPDLPCYPTLENFFTDNSIQIMDDVIIDHCIRNLLSNVKINHCY